MTKSRFSKKDDPSWITNLEIWQEYQHFCVAAMVAMESVDQDMAVAILLSGDGIECVASQLSLSDETVGKVVESMLDPTWSELYEKLIFPLEQPWPQSKSGEPGSPDYIYLMLDPFTGYHKIGRSINPKRRVKELNRNIPPGGTTVVLVHQFEVENSTNAERDLHNLYSKERVQQEWFDLNLQDIQSIRDMNGYKDGIFHFTYYE